MPLIRTGQSVALLLLPHGGQRAARRNAWAGMVSDSARSRAGREAQAAMDRAARLPARTAAH